MFNSQHKSFPNETVSLLAHMMNMTLNKAEQLSRHNQLMSENLRVNEISETINNIEKSSGKKDPPSPVIKPVRLKTNENKSMLAETNNIVVDVHCEDGATESESVKIEAPKECPSTVFNYMMRARKDNRIIYAPAKIVVTQLRDPGVDICFHVDMQAYSQIPSLHLRIICPNYEPKQAWINGKECMIHG